MKPHLHAANIIMIVIKAVLITAAILFLGSFFGLHVREAGGNVAATLSERVTEPT